MLASVYIVSGALPVFYTRLYNSGGGLDVGAFVPSVATKRGISRNQVTLVSNLATLP